MRKKCDCGKMHTAATKKCPACIQTYRKYRKTKRREARVMEANRYSMIPGGGEAWRIIDQLMPGEGDLDRDHLIPYSLCEKLFHWLVAADRVGKDSKEFAFNCAQHPSNVLKLDDTKNRAKSNTLYKNLISFVFGQNDSWYDYFDDADELAEVAKSLGFEVKKTYSLNHYDNFK